MKDKELMYNLMSFFSILGGLLAIWFYNDIVAVACFWIAAGIFKLCTVIQPKRKKNG